MVQAVIRLPAGASQVLLLGESALHTCSLHVLYTLAPVLNTSHMSSNTNAAKFSSVTTEKTGSDMHDSMYACMHNIVDPRSITWHQF